MKIFQKIPLKATFNKITLILLLLLIIIIMAIYKAPVSVRTDAHGAVNSLLLVNYQNHVASSSHANAAS